MLQQLWTSRTGAWVATGLAVLGVVLVARFVDLSPRVEGDFFFAEDDPQMLASQQVSERFPGGAQVIIRVEDLVGDTAAYRARVASLATELLEVEGVVGGYSIGFDDPSRSPLFERILLTPDSAATNVVLTVDETDPEILLPRLEGGGRRTPRSRDGDRHVRRAGHRRAHPAQPLPRSHRVQRGRPCSCSASSARSCTATRRLSSGR